MVSGFSRSGFPDDFVAFHDKRLAATDGHSENGRDSKSLGHLAVQVGKESEREFVFLLEFFLRCGGIPTHSEDLEVLGTQVRK